MRVTESRNGQAERRVLTAMLTDAAVLARIVPKWTEDGLFESSWANLVGGWAVTYHRKHKNAPGKAIESIFEEWVATGRGEATEAVEGLLRGLSGEHERNGECNTEHAIDLAGRHFNRVRQGKLRDGIDSCLRGNKIDRADELIRKYSRVEMGIGSGVDILRDAAEIEAAWEQGKNPLIQYPGDAGQFFQRSLVREGLVSFLGRSKVGKSYWLLDMAWRAILQRRKVAYFECGDLMNEIRDRIIVRAAERPMHSPTGTWPLEVEWPKEIKKRKGSDPEVRCERRTFAKALTPKEGVEACFSVMREQVKSKRCYLKLSMHSSRSLNVPTMRSMLDAWELDGWTPDVVICDYVDILAPVDRKVDRREQINDTWIALRAMSQDLHCLVVTATQSNRDSFGKRYLDMDDVSDDKRKLDHATAMIGLNATKEEKDLNLMRLNMVLLRSGRFNSSRCLSVAQCLALANPCVLSSF